MKSKGWNRRTSHYSNHDRVIWDVGIGRDSRLIAVIAVEEKPFSVNLPNLNGSVRLGRRLPEKLGVGQNRTI